MKTALVLALLGACVAVGFAHHQCYGDYEYECVKDDYKKCKAVKVCEGYKKEKCGYDYCEYGSVCASKKKEVCKDFIKLKEKCEKKKVCKEVKKECGYDYCGYDEECVKAKICEVKHVYGRRLLHHGAHATAEAEAHAGHHHHDDGHDHGKKFGDYYFEHCPYCKKKEKLECYDAYACEKKEPCKEVIVKKCVKDHYRPGHDVCHGGHDFKWYEDYSYGEKCGDEYCGHGYKCADVYYQKCEAEECGDHYCQYGYECVAEDDDCKKYAYLETICKDVYEPTCIHLGYYAQQYYYPKCKTVYKCDKEENICGGEYCPYGYTCALKKCGYYDEPEYYGYPDHKDDYGYPDHKDDYEPGYGHEHDPDHKDDHYTPKRKGKGHGKKHGGASSASSSSTAYSGPHGSYTTTYTTAHGDHAKGTAGASASGPGSHAHGGSSSRAFDGNAKADTFGYAASDGYYGRSAGHAGGAKASSGH